MFALGTDDILFRLACRSSTHRRLIGALLGGGRFRDRLARIRLRLLPTLLLGELGTAVGLVAFLRVLRRTI